MATVAVVLVLTFLALMVALVRADRRRPRHVPFPWLWVLPPIGVLGLSVLVGAARYPSLPNEIPVHFDLTGTADEFVPTTPFSAFFLVVTQVLVTAVLAAVAGLVLRTPYPESSAPGRPDEAATIRRAGAAAFTARALLLLATGLDLAFFLLAQPIWRGRSTLSSTTVTGAMLAVAAGVVAVLIAAVRSTEAGSGAAEPGDHWRGIFYVNRNDPRLLVPKRIGIGWTINFGHPAGWALMAGLIFAPLVTALLGHLV